MRKQTLLILASLALMLTLAASALGKDKPKSKLKAQPPHSTPSLEVRNAVYVEKIGGVRRTAPGRACTGDKLSFAARLSSDDPQLAKAIKWQSDSGRGAMDADGNFVIETGGLPPGTYIVTASAFDAASGCTTYDSKTFSVGDCESSRTCFDDQPLLLSTPLQVVGAGEMVNISAGQVHGGEHFGQLTAHWTTSAGTITGNLESAVLDTTGALPGSEIKVRLRVTSEYANCEAAGELSVKTSLPPIPLIVELTPCDTFKPNSPRVDNACTYVLQDALRRLESDPQARLVIDTYYRTGEDAGLAKARGKNVRDRLADGSLGVTVDANRLIVRPAGQAADKDQVKFYLVPPGVALPNGASAVDVGPVAKEPSRPAAKKRRRR